MDADVAIVGGGPAGCSAGVFTARYGLETVVFDRGRSSIRRCAHLENYLGFPAGIDVGTFYGLVHDHAEAAGCSVVPDLVESVDRAEAGGARNGEEDDGGTGTFRVTTQEGRRVTARRVVAATRYVGEYLRPLTGDAAFLTDEHAGEVHEHFDRSYADRDGSTPVPGLYVASPSEEADRQAIVAAGRGARVGLAVVEDLRRERGLQDAVAAHYDWIRRAAELDDEWADRDRWRAWFDERLPDGTDAESDRLLDLREREIDRRLDTYLADVEIERRVERGQERLLDHVDDDLILEAAADIRAARGSAEARDRPAGGD